MSGRRGIIKTGRWTLALGVALGMGWRLAPMDLSPAAAKADVAEGLKTNTPASGPPPLVVDKEAPLLLEEPAAKSQLSSKKAADNSPCFVCHVNYQDEELARGHAQAGTGCVDCHGPSFAHRNDENNTTPPDVIYPAAKIEGACQSCHPQHDVPAGKVIAAWQKRGSRKTDPKSIVCTDCHGHHRLAIRTVRWNKVTRELIK